MAEQDTLNVKVVGPTPTWPINFNAFIARLKDSDECVKITPTRTKIIASFLGEFSRVGAVQVLQALAWIDSFFPVTLKLEVMANKNYELIEHTADVGIRVRGKDLEELFVNAAFAMFDIIAQKLEEPSSPKIRKFRIIQEVQDKEELLINWLNELLSLSSAKETIFCHFKFNKLDRSGLDVDADGCDISGYQVNAEIKAATYHGLKLEETKSGWQAEIIFDV